MSSLVTRETLDGIDRMSTFSLQSLCRGARNTGLGPVAQDVLAHRTMQLQGAFGPNDPQTIDRTVSGLDDARLAAFAARSAAVRNPDATPSDEVRQQIEDGLQELMPNEAMLLQLVEGGAVDYVHDALRREAEARGLVPGVDGEDVPDDDGDEVDADELSRLVAQLNDDQLRALAAMLAVARHPDEPNIELSDEDQAVMDRAIRTMTPEQRTGLVGAAGSDPRSVVSRVLAANVSHHFAGRGLTPFPTVTTVEGHSEPDEDDRGGATDYDEDDADDQDDEDTEE
jgi:hypothetical protein